MAALHLVTGHQGSAHITSADQGEFNAGCVGTGDYVLGVGRMFAAEAVTANAVRIYDGSAVMQGRHIKLDPGTFLDAILTNGTSGVNRNDLIAIRYSKSNNSGIENVGFVVIQGTPTSGTASDPSHTTGDILAGATAHEMPMFRVRFEGLSIVGVEPMFNVVASLSDIHKQNLLVNGDFNCNQRGQTSYNSTSSALYSFDMWRIYKMKLEKVTGGGVRVTGNSESESGYLTQFVPVDKFAEKYTICAKVDGKIYSFTTALETTASEKVFGKFKIAALRTTNGNIKINICSIGIVSFTVEYVDLFEGSIAYPHVKEDKATALMRCKKYVQEFDGAYPIAYSYFLENASGDMYHEYAFCISHVDFDYVPSIESVTYKYFDLSGGSFTSSKIGKASIECTKHRTTLRTTDDRNFGMHETNHAIYASGILTCEARYE